MQGLRATAVRPLGKKSMLSRNPGTKHHVDRQTGCEVSYSHFVYTSLIRNVVINMCEKFHHDRLRNDRALGNRKSDNNNNPKKKKQEEKE